MIYEVFSLEEIYRIFSKMAENESIAIFDFLSGELGYEFMGAQVFGGQFFDRHKDNAKVVALCWKGMSVAYQHVSHDQIELIDEATSIRGNRKHQGGRRNTWLAKQHHGDRLHEIKNIVAYHPHFGISEKALRMRYGISQTELLRGMVNRLIDGQISFESFPRWRAILDPYILAFDRFDKHEPARNTQSWQLEALGKIADNNGCVLAVRSGFFPRDAPRYALQYSPTHRQLGLMCNLVRNALFFAGPVSGMTTACVAFGCNFLALGNRKTKTHDELIIRMVEERGFEYLGLMNRENEIPDRVEEFLVERLGM